MFSFQQSRKPVRRDHLDPQFIASGGGSFQKAVTRGNVTGPREELQRDFASEPGIARNPDL
ncbi:MAG TPA: hypothetical protein VM534_07065, partial [Thermoanaerobaculia bacterium]|nr:hypothetical protein [Thermoanaerobaculia bacterium]